MAAPVLTRSVALCDVPFLIRELTVTSGATATALAHGGPALAPEIVFATCTTENPTGGDYAVTAKSTTTVTLDFEDDGNETWKVYCLWLSITGGGIS